VYALDVPLSSVADKDIRIGLRLDIHALLKEEIVAGWEKADVVL
jgi:hypothetical protein